MISIENMYMKRCSISLIIRTTMRYHFISVKVATFTNEGSQVKESGVEKMEPLSSSGGIVNRCSHCRKYCGWSTKIKNRTTIWSSNLLSGYIFKENEIWALMRYLYWYSFQHQIYIFNLNGRDINITALSWKLEKYFVVFSKYNNTKK